MKRFTKAMVALLLVAAMIVTLCPVATAANFIDVNANMSEEFRDAINYVSDNGLMIGGDPNFFYPNAFMTRAEFMLTLYRSAEVIGSFDGADIFTDVSEDSVYYDAIGCAVENGITAGATATTFEPDSYVTREQAMMFFYRLAGLDNYDRTADEVLSNAVDYETISEYAYDAISWAYEYGVLTRDTVYDHVYPKSYLRRKDTALYTARYRRNIEGIVRYRDHFSFINTDEHLVSGNNTTVLISDDDWNLFEQLALSQGMAQTRINQIETRNWIGSCHGMAIATILDYLGKIDLNGNFCNDASNLFWIPFLNDITDEGHILTTDHLDSSIVISEVESKISFYQNSQFLPEIADWMECISTDRGLREMLLALENSGIGLFTYEMGDDGGHSVVAYGKPIVTETGYKVRVYDNRDWTHDYWIVITEEYGSLRGRLVGEYHNDVITSCKFQSDFSVYNDLDIDNYNNVLSINANENNNQVTLEVMAKGGFTITNSEGETLIHSTDGSGVTGTMDVSGINMIPFGPGQPCAYLFIVDNSEEFTCVAHENAEVESFTAMTNEFVVEDSLSAYSVANEDLMVSFSEVEQN